MTWLINDSNVYVMLLRIFTIAGVILGIGIFLLVGHFLPGKDRRLGHRLMGGFFGVGICLAFMLLGGQMTSGRFTEVTIEEERVTLKGVEGDVIELDKANVHHIMIKGEAKSRYLTITRRDGEQLKGGPCNDQCDPAVAALNTWLGPDPVE